MEQNSERIALSAPEDSVPLLFAKVSKTEPQSSDIFCIDINISPKIKKQHNAGEDENNRYVMDAHRLFSLFYVHKIQSRRRTALNEDKRTFYNIPSDCALQ